MEWNRTDNISHNWYVYDLKKGQVYSENPNDNRNIFSKVEEFGADTPGW